MKIFSEAVSKDPNNFDSEKINEYDQLASSREISGFKAEIEKKIETKVKELGMLEDLKVVKEKLIDLADLDLESLSAENLENSSNGDLEFIRDSIDEAINRFQINEETKELIIDVPSSIDKLLKFVEKHEKVIKIGEYALYLSTLGMPVFDALAEDDVKIEIGGRYIPLKDLADDQKLIGEISQELGSPIQAIQENISEKITSIYEEAKDLPDKDIQNENLDESIKEADKFLDYAEFIQNSEKGSIDDIVEDIKEKGTDALLFGEYHGHDSSVARTVEVLEKMQDDDHKIAKIALEALSYTDPKAIELVEQFNNREISAEDFYYGGSLYARSDIRPILEFAQNNNIPIAGIETGEHGAFNPNDLSRFTEISHRVAEIVEEEKEEGIIAVFAGARHTTESNFNLDDIKTSEYKEGREKIDEEDYTIKGHLEELGFKPAAINLDDWKEFAKNSDEYFRESYNKLEEENAGLFGDHCLENWENYKLDQEDVFAVNHGEGENVYSIVSPGEITEVPSSLNALKSIEDNHPGLKEIIHKEGVYLRYYDDKILLEHNGEITNMTKMDSENGQIKEVFLPEDEDASNKVVLEQMGKIERLKKILGEYDPRLHKKEREIKENKKMSNAIEEARKKLKNIYSKRSKDE